jgi:Ca2+-binding RTX toxin-like protein/Tol biopolymer transport system component
MATIVGGASNDVLVGNNVAAPVALLALPGIGSNEMNARWSPDGTKIYFQTGAIGLIPEDPNYNTDVYILDVATGALSLATAGAGFDAYQSSRSPSISADGQRLLFFAIDLSGPPGGGLYVRDMATGLVTAIDLGGRSSVDEARFSSDGTKIVFSSSEVPRHTSVAIKDLSSGAVTLVADESLTPSFSPNGTKVVFASWTDFGSGYNGYAQIYIRELGTGLITQVSTSAAGVTGDREARNPVFSPDGTKLLFESDASNLVAGDTNGRSDIFLKDLVTGEVTRVSISATGAQGNGYYTSRATFSSDGSKVLFSTNSTNLIADGLGGGFLLKDLATGAITRAGGEFWAILAPDDTHLAYMATSPTWVDTIYLKDLASGVDLISGGDGNDRIEGLGGDDELYGEGGNDLLLGDDGDPATADGNDILHGGAGNDVLIGGKGDDVLDGGEGDDVLLNGVAPGTLSSGGVASTGLHLNVDGGADRIDGGAGTDQAILFYNDRTASIVFDNTNSAALNTVWVGGAASGSVTNVERITFHGGQGADTIATGAGADFLWGLGGADILDGGAGVDAAIYDDKTQSVVVTLNGAADAVVTVGGVAEDTLRNIENVFGGSGADSLTGNAGGNVLSGGAGDDLLAGRGGADLLNGEEGVDTVSFDDKVDAVEITLTGAVNTTAYVAGVAEDTVRNVENVIGGHGDDLLVGDGVANALTGGDGADILDGAGGDDVLTGGAGVDTASFASSAETGVTVDLRVTGQQDTGQGLDTLVSIESLSGSAWDDVLTGDNASNGLIGGSGQDWLQSLKGVDVLVGGDGADSVWGGDGDDVLEGGDGDDTVDGGAGVDTASYLTAESGVSINLAFLEEQNTRGAGVDTLVSIENLVGSSHDDDLYGNAGVNVLDGAGGEDWIVGFGGADVLTGGAGPDHRLRRRVQPAAELAPRRCDRAVEHRRGHRRGGRSGLPFRRDGRSRRRSPTVL